MKISTKTNLTIYKRMHRRVKQEKTLMTETITTRRKEGFGKIQPTAKNDKKTMQNAKKTI